VIVVVGLPRLGGSHPPRATGLAVEIARRAAGAGVGVQLMGKVGDDPEGDLALLDLARSGVAHPAMLRDHARRTPVGSGRAATERGPAPTLEPADLELGLRYVPDFRVLVVAVPDAPALISVAAEAATFAGAHLIVISNDGGHVETLPERSTVLTAPRGEAGESALAGLVATYAVALDAGDDSIAAWRTALAAAGAEGLP
jgi:sugar/nucleoside kinase (ribokinase family)